MSLPVNNVLSYSLEVPSSKKKISYRPYVVKEQKELLLAQQSEDLVVMVDTLKNVIKSCTNGSVDVDSLAMYDLEYIFTQIRARSTGEISTLKFPCDKCNAEEDKWAKVDIDLTTLKVKFPEKFTDTIEIGNGLGIKMKAPTVDIIKRIKDVNTEAEAMFEIVIDSIDFIYDSSKIWKSSDYSVEELSAWLGELTNDQFKQIMEYFTNMPKLSHVVEYTCPVCKAPHKTTIEGIQSFF